MKQEQTEEAKVEIPDSLPIIPLRDIVIFPYMIFPLFIGRESTIKSVDQALSEERMVFLVSQKDAATETPEDDDLNRVGTVAIIMRMLKLPDGKVKILVQGVARAKIKEIEQTEPFIRVKLEKLKIPPVPEKTLQVEALMKNVVEQLEKMNNLGKSIPSEIMVFVSNIEDPGRLSDLIIANLDLKVEEAQEVLEILDPMERLRKVSEILNKEIQILSIQQDIVSQAKGEMDKTQREYFLRQQLKKIQEELGEGSDTGKEILDLREKLSKTRMPKEVREVAEKQIARLESMHTDSAEAGVVRTYLDWILELPWKKSTRDRLDINQAQEVLDEDHHDLEKVKTRLLEYLAVRKLKKKMKGPILCFVGPPGVGKTSLGKSIARALNRKFHRISLGGVRDEAEIRGHRRTYVGALPGRIIQGIRQVKTNNPVFMMDEVDKIGADFRGDPSAALLEVLDPEQNFEFRDHYLELPFDLSNVMFITTANLLEPIHPAFRDRMEIIEIPGYAEEEKLQIAKKYLIPKQIEENGITRDHIELPDQTVIEIIREYTAEAGVRNLERTIGSLCRKVARKVAEGEEAKKTIHHDDLVSYLGAPRFLEEKQRDKDLVGVVNGLAVTQVGGDRLSIEVTCMEGKGQLILTGQLGEVMKESATAALSYARSIQKEIGAEDIDLTKTDVHVHVPAGATPKDGPSAGITIACALVSMLAQKPVSHKIAMTGEITLTGRVLRIGGVKQKLLAAKRAKMEKVILPLSNTADYEELKEEDKRGLEIEFADTMDDVINLVFPGLLQS